jgi:IS605 OrfB family transposase
MPTITRKIQISFDVADKKELKELYEKWFTYQHIVQRSANFIATHLWIQDNIKDLFYFTEDVKVKLGDADKDVAGILTSSRGNTVYQVLSKNFKGEAPMGMLSGLARVIAQTYAKESKDVRYGKRSLRSYRNNIPMPMRMADTSNWTKHEDGNYSFSVYGTDFKTWFGKDLSDNESIMDRALQSNEYKLCDSSIQFEKIGGKTKIFLLAVFTFDKQLISLDPEKIADCWLSEEYPIIIKEKAGKIFTIGIAAEYLHKRLAIKGAMYRSQKLAKYNTGGSGRKLKMESLDRFKDAESNYINNRMHTYSRELIKYCLKRNIGKIILNNYQEAVEETHKETEESKLLLATWSYYNLSDKIKYKASIHGIEVEVL